MEDTWLVITGVSHWSMIALKSKAFPYGQRKVAWLTIWSEMNLQPQPLHGLSQKLYSLSHSLRSKWRTKKLVSWWSDVGKPGWCEHCPYNHNLFCCCYLMHMGEVLGLVGQAGTSNYKSQPRTIISYHFSIVRVTGMSITISSTTLHQDTEQRIEYITSTRIWLWYK